MMETMIFNKESDFEQALIDLLKTKGWEDTVLSYPTEEELINNWAEILFENNRGIDRLDKYPLTSTEMRQILDKVTELKTPLRLSGFINGGSVSIIRDHPADKAHFGKEIPLKIYDRKEIAAGQSRYQIVRQPKFPTKCRIMNDRRGDLMLLINGMPVIHIELKRSGENVEEATNQIEKYAGEGIFSGLFSLVQIFVAMEPRETLYFANPGPDGKFNNDFYFHWADFNNDPINDWDQIGRTLLSIPMAHQLIGFYTVADGSDGILKVMRSYQYNAANKISDKVAKVKWDDKDQLGGYIWHTTGSGKTMTSFKSAQLIADSKDADKVVFLMDRIELGTQSLKEYRNFAGADLTEDQRANTVQETEDTYVLIGKLKSTDPADTLIVTSIQKMSNISADKENMKVADIEVINRKRLVFIIDEAHRSTFGEMLLTIKNTFPKAVFFGFTGTPIQKENQKMLSTTAMVFGNELHRYSIADGIRDKNVLGFDPHKVLTFKDEDVRKAVALEQSKAVSVEEAMSDPRKKKIFLEFMNKRSMTGSFRTDGKYIKGIEDYLKSAQYETVQHQSMVVEDIVKNWEILSQCGKFHAILATSSIPEALEYYRHFKFRAPSLKVTALFDPNIDNKGGEKSRNKEDGLVEVISDYNENFNQKFTIPSYAKMKKDIADRLAHKKPYERLDRTPDQQLNLLIVVDQMLTGFDSKWINTLYLDKLLDYENIIQAFSRTNRIFGLEKPFGTIKYYRKPHTMAKNIDAAIKLYSGDKPFGIFVQRLYSNLVKINSFFGEIKELFESENIENFEELPSDPATRRKFSELFRELNQHLVAAKIQGFKWDCLDYCIKDEDSGKNQEITVRLDETTYQILVQRHKELFSGRGSNGSSDVPYDLEGCILPISTVRIDFDYMNSRFEKYTKLLHASGEGADDLRKAEDELHKTFATLSQEEQKFANIFLHDIQCGDILPVPGKSFRDYLTEYAVNAQNDKIHKFAQTFGLDEKLLRNILMLHPRENNLNEFGRFDSLKSSINTELAKFYFENKTGAKLSKPKVNIKIDELLREFILHDGCDF